MSVKEKDGFNGRVGAAMASTSRSRGREELPAERLG